jgi:hypothetical protein
MLDLVRFVFHPCRVAGLQRHTNTILNLLWDGCERNYENDDVDETENGGSG